MVLVILDGAMLIQAVVLKLAMLCKGLPIVGYGLTLEAVEAYGSEPYAHPELRPLADHIHVWPILTVQESPTSKSETLHQRS